MGQAADQLSDTGTAPQRLPSAPNPMGSSQTDDLRAQIERQRSELGRDLEVLGDKVSPGRAIERRKASMRMKAQDWRERIMGAADETSHRMHDTADSVKGSMHETADSMEQRLHEAPQRARQTAQGNPLAVGLMAFGAGAVLAAVLPTSRKEREMAHEAEPMLRHAAEEAGSMARHAADELKPMAEDAANRVKEDAKHAADEVKHQAQGAAEETKGSAKGAADEVRSSAESSTSTSSTPSTGRTTF